MGSTGVDWLVLDAAREDSGVSTGRPDEKVPEVGDRGDVGDCGNDDGRCRMNDLRWRGLRSLTGLSGSGLLLLVDGLRLLGGPGRTGNRVSRAS